MSPGMASSPTNWKTSSTVAMLFFGTNATVQANLASSAGTAAAV